MMPARLFTEVTIIYAKEFANVFQHEIRPQVSGGIYPFEGLDNPEAWKMHNRYPKLNALILLSPKTLPVLSRSDTGIPDAEFRSMMQASEQRGHWVYAVQRFPSTYLFVICGHSDQDIFAGFSELMKAPHRFTGFMTEVAK